MPGGKQTTAALRTGKFIGFRKRDKTYLPAMMYSSSENYLGNSSLRLMKYFQVKGLADYCAVR
jgi:hypothetical protein